MTKKPCIICALFLAMLLLNPIGLSKSLARKPAPASRPKETIDNETNDISNSFFQTTRVHRYRASKNESFSKISVRFYGNSESQNFLLTYNGLTSRDLRKGTEIQIPNVMDYIVRRGDTLAAIAQRYLGKAERFPFLMSNSELSGYPEVEAGMHLKIPFSLTITPNPSVSIESLAKYYAEPYGREMILAYNGLPRDSTAPLHLENPKPASSPGAPAEAFNIPLMAFVAYAGDAKPSYETRRGPPLLAKAIQTYNDGHFKETLDLLERARKAPWNSFFEWSLIHRYEAFCLVAFGQLDAAHNHLVTMKSLDSNADLGGTEVSPKIRRLFSELHGEKPL